MSVSAQCFYSSDLFFFFKSVANRRLGMFSGGFGIFLFTRQLWKVSSLESEWKHDVVTRQLQTI